MMCASVCVIEG